MFKTILMFAVGLFFCSPVLALDDKPGQYGFYEYTIEIDGSKRQATIPKAWVLFSVSNGEKMNSNNLWFRAPDGNVYVVTGFIKNNGEFIFDGLMGKLPVK